MENDEEEQIVKPTKRHRPEHEHSIGPGLKDTMDRWLPAFWEWTTLGDGGMKQRLPRFVLEVEQKLRDWSFYDPHGLFDLLVEVVWFYARFRSLPDVLDSLEQAGLATLLQGALQEKQANSMDIQDGANVPTFLSDFPALFSGAGGGGGGLHAHDDGDMVACSLHDMRVSERIHLGQNCLRLIMGNVRSSLVMPHLYAFIYTLFLIDARSAALCEMSHELVHLLLPTQHAASLESLLAGSPDEFLVDVLVTQKARMFEVFGNSDRNSTLFKRVLSVLQTAVTLEPVRVPFRRNLSRLIRDGMRPESGGLTSYQRVAIQWIDEREKLGVPFRGGLVAPVPGMGKTRILSTVVRLSPPGSLTLAIVPLSVMDEWGNENTKSFRTESKLRIFLCHADKDGQFVTMPENYDLIVTTIDTFLERSHLHALRVDRLVVDESHTLSNEKGKKYKQLLDILDRMHVPCRWGLTGTPFRNVRSDIYGQLRLMGYKGPRNAPAKDLLSNVYQLEYGPDTVVLPLPVEVEMPVALDPLEWELYKQIYDYTTAITFKKKSGAFQMMKNVNNLRQMTLSMDLVKPDVVESLRVDALSASPEQFEQPSLWGLLKSVVTKVMDMTERLLVPHEMDDPSDVDDATDVDAMDLPEDRKLGVHYISSRIRAVMRLMADIFNKNPNDKVIVFCNFETALKRLFERLNEASLDYEIALFSGSISVKHRTALKKRFMEDDRLKMISITYQAGGAGLNLQRANHMIMMDPTWNPATDDQATARARRLGQPKIVYIYRLFAPRTIEERMNELRRRKARDWSAMRLGKELVETAEDDNDEAGFFQKLLANVS